MNCFKYLIGGILLALAGTATAGNSVVSVEAQGSGKTEREATDEALARAAGKVNGANVDVDSKTVRAGYSANATSTWGGQSSVNANAELSRSAGYQAQGQIKGYKVLSSQKIDGGYRVRVKADVLRYDVPAENNALQRMAIFPVRYRPGTYPFYGGISGAELARQMGTELESKILSSRQFSLLDRNTLGASLAELGLIDSDLTSPEEKAKLQRFKGADYILVATIREAADRYDERVNPATGQLMGEFRFELETRVIVPATGELRASNVYRIKKQRDRDAAMEVMGTKAASGLVDEIFPGRGASVRAAVLDYDEPEPDTPRDTSGVRLPFDR